jgi:hypothetical protein
MSDKEKLIQLATAVLESHKMIHVYVLLTGGSVRGATLNCKDCRLAMEILND